MNRTITTLLPLLTLMACAEGMQSETPDPNKARFEGRYPAAANAEDGSPERNATAVAFLMNADGSMTALEGEADVKADGSFMLDVPLDTTTSDVVVQIMTEGEARAEALVTDEAENGEVTYVAPLDAETTLETSIMAEIRNTSRWDDAAMSEAWLRGWVTADVAASAMANGTYDDAVEAAADNTISAMLAFSDSFVATGSADAQATFDAAIESMTRLQIETDKKRFEAMDDEEAEVAAEAQADAMITVWTDAGASAETTAKATWAATTTILSGTADVAAELETQSEIALSYQIEAATKAQLEAMDASSNAMLAVENSAMLLRTELDAAASSSTMDEDIANAWADFDADVRTVVEGEVETLAIGVLTDLEASIDLAVDALVDGMAEVETASTAQARAQAAVDALADFDANTMTTAQLSLLTTAGLSETEAEALVAIYAQLALGMRASS